METAGHDLYHPRLGLPPCLPPAAYVSVCSIRPGLLNVGTITRLDSGKVSLCPFNKHSQRASSVAGPGLTEGSLPRCAPAPQGGALSLL